MGKKRLLLIATALAVIFCLGIFAWALRDTTGPEPTYQGKPLSHWLSAFDPGWGSGATNPPPPPAVSDADTALQAMRDDAIPHLLRKLHYRDAKLKRFILGILSKQKLIKITPVPQYSHFTAYAALSRMGPSASNAVPGLVEYFEHDPSPFPQTAVPNLLGSIGSPAAPAIPTLLKAAAHTNGIVRNNAIRALGKVHADPGRVVPVLASLLHDPDPLVRANAALALGEFKSDAKSSVPALVEQRRKEPHSTNAAFSFNYGTPAGIIWLQPRWSGVGLGTNPNVALIITSALESIDPAAVPESDAK
jgi:hypothetical protein